MQIANHVVIRQCLHFDSTNQFAHQLYIKKTFSVRTALRRAQQQCCQNSWFITNSAILGPASVTKFLAPWKIPNPQNSAILENWQKLQCFSGFHKQKITKVLSKSYYFSLKICLSKFPRIYPKKLLKKIFFLIFLTNLIFFFWKFVT